MIDQTVGPYRVLQKLGEGGMGVVYRARDTRLGRDVAIKVLPPAFSTDPDRMARFGREAHVLASLNHPNIASLYGLEESDGVRALVMELVEGPTLAERIAESPLTLAETLSIAADIARALESAHDRGIVHRDLKPANIKIAPDGAVKVLDFGLAKALDGEAPGDDPQNSPTMSLAATRAGVILGTAAYMSPEQAKGKPVDKRADIWAFGVVLAEMLSGRPLFSGETVSETMAAVMKDEPVIPDAPPAIQALLRRCLQRDPRRRMRDIGEARLVLEDPASAEWPRAVAAASVAQPRRVGILWWVGAALALAVGVGAGWVLRGAPGSPQTPLRKFAIPVEKLSSGPARHPVISPDGMRIVYGADGKLWVRDLAALEPREIVASATASNFFWSPDSAHIGYFADGKMWKTPVHGGTASVIAAVSDGRFGNGMAAAWRSDGRVVFAQAVSGSGLAHVSADGGDFAPLLAPGTGEQDFHDVTPLPDGRGVVYAVDMGSNLVDRLAVFDGRAAKTILHLEGESIRKPFYAPTGHIVYERTTTNPGVWAVAFALDALETRGEPFLVAPLGTVPSVSNDGALVVVRALGPELRELVWVDRSGHVGPAIGPPAPGMVEPAISPDGRRVAVGAGGPGRHDIWVTDVTRGTSSRLTFADGDERGPLWSPASDVVYFDMQAPRGSTVQGRPAGPNSRVIARQPADGNGQPVVVSEFGLSPTISRDGKFLGFQAPGKDRIRTGSDLWYMPLDRAAAPVQLLEATAYQGAIQFSPDGRYYLYVSMESGPPQLFVKPFPTGDGRWQISSGEAAQVKWSRDADRIIYVDPVTRVMWEVPVTTTPTFTLGKPRELFTVPQALPNSAWDLAPDGRFVFVRDAGGAPRETPAITVVQNWFAEFADRQRGK